MDRAKLKIQLKVDEGIRYRRYLDTVGKWTIGVGHNISDDPHYHFTLADEPLSDRQVMALLEDDINETERQLDARLPWWRTLNDARQNVLANMCFNMGITTLSTFRNTLRAMKEGRFTDAAHGMEQSKWYTQVGDRAKRLVAIMRAGF